MCLFFCSRTAPRIYLRCLSPAISRIQPSTSQMKQLMAVVSKAMSSPPTLPFHLSIHLSNRAPNGRARAHRSGASALPNRVYNVVLAGRQLAMWTPSQGVSRIPCLRFESLALFSQPFQCANPKKHAAAIPPTGPPAGLCTSWLLSGIVVELAAAVSKAICMTCWANCSALGNGRILYLAWTGDLSSQRPALGPDYGRAAVPDSAGMTSLGV